MAIGAQHICRQNRSYACDLRIAVETRGIVYIHMVDVPRHAVGENRQHVGPLHRSERVREHVWIIGREQDAPRHRHVQREIHECRQRLAPRRIEIDHRHIRIDGAYGTFLPSSAVSTSMATARRVTCCRELPPANSTAASAAPTSCACWTSSTKLTLESPTLMAGLFHGSHCRPAIRSTMVTSHSICA